MVYKKPELIKIDMKIGETVLGDACKTDSQTGAADWWGTCYINMDQDTCDSISGS